MEPPRSLQQRQQDTLGRLESDADAWIASADAEGDAYLLPLSFLWDGAGLVVATPSSSVTGRNLSQGGQVRVGVGQSRDVTMNVDPLAGLPLMVPQLARCSIRYAADGVRPSVDH